MGKSEIRELVKKIWEAGIVDADELHEIYDAAERNQRVKELFEDYWKEEGDKITYKIVQE